MSKPDIPADVLAVAEAHHLDAIVMTAEDEPKAIVRMIARAILAERERCAKVAENFYGGRAHTYASENGDVYLAQDLACSGIAAAIRGGTTPIGAAATQSDGGGE